VLGDIPGLGLLFRSRSSTVTKRTLMVFIRPVIIRDRATATIQTNSKYRLMREIQLGESEDGSVLMMKGEPRPTIPELPADADRAPISVDEGGIPDGSADQNEDGPAGQR